MGPGGRSERGARVEILPEANRSDDNALGDRIYVGRVKIRIAWSKRSAEGRDHLSFELDDPSFAVPHCVNLSNDEAAEGSALIWSSSQGERRLSRPEPTPPPRNRTGLLYATGATVDANVQDREREFHCIVRTNQPAPGKATERAT